MSFQPKGEILLQVAERFLATRRLEMTHASEFPFIRNSGYLTSAADKAQIFSFMSFRPKGEILLQVAERFLAAQRLEMTHAAKFFLYPQFRFINAKKAGGNASLF